mgnify:CR=1 FL=1
MGVEGGHKKGETAFGSRSVGREIGSEKFDEGRAGAGADGN